MTKAAFFLLRWHTLATIHSAIWRFFFTFQKKSNNRNLPTKKKETFFNEVIELPSGTYLKIDSESISSPCRYWKPQTVEDESLSYADVVAMTKDAIINAVKIRMRSDVPLAFLHEWWSGL